MLESVPEPAGLAQLLVLTEVLDQDGRPILEGKSPLMSAVERAKALVPCPFEQSPSRFGQAKPMNMAALEQVRANFGDFLALLARLRRLRSELVGGRPLRLLDQHQICMYGEVLPRWMLLRAHVAAGGGLAQFSARRVPIEVGIVFKTVRGLLRLTRLLLDRPHEVVARLPAQRRRALGLDQVPRHRPKKSTDQAAPFVYDRAAAGQACQQAAFTAEDLSTITEEFGLLIGDEEVCAAPPGMITATLAALVDADGRGPAEALSAELEAALADAVGLDRFASTLDRVYADLARLRSQAADLLGPTQRALPALQPDNVPAELRRYLLHEREFLARAVVHEGEVLAAAGAPPRPGGLNERLIDRLVDPHPRSMAQRLLGLEVQHRREHTRLRFRTGQEQLLGGPTIPGLDP
jgi:hypothetical protein